MRRQGWIISKILTEKAVAVAIVSAQGEISRATAWLDNLIAVRADGEISKEQIQTLRQKAEIGLADLNEKLNILNAAFDDETDAPTMAVIENALDSILDFSGPLIYGVSSTNSCAVSHSWIIPLSSELCTE